MITWETGWCSEGIHSSGNDAGCVVGGAPNPTIISIVNTCAGGPGSIDDGGSPSNPGGIPGDSGSGGYDTTPYAESEAELIEMNRIFRLKLNPSQLSWYDSHLVLGMDLARLYNTDPTIEHLNFLKSMVDYMKASNITQDTLLFANIVSFLKQDGSYQENWTLINNILMEHNPDLGVAVLSFVKENLDILNKAEIITRIKALDDALVQNPNLLLDIPCNQLPLWQSVATHQIPESVKTKMKNIKNQTNYYDNWQLTDLDNGLGTKINMDLFPVKISSLPNRPNSNQKYTPDEFFDFFRKNINLFAEKFVPIKDDHYAIDDTGLWFSNNPLGTLIHIKIPFDDGTVVCSGYWTNSWMFTTVKAPLDWSHDGIHPVAGNRLFSYYMDPNDNAMYIYTRGVDRVSHNYSDNSIVLNYLIQTGAFLGADKLWNSMQDKLSEYVIARGGSADKVTAVRYRPNYIKVMNYIKGNAALSSLGCN